MSQHQAGGRVPRAVGVVAIFVAFVVGVAASHGCIDDRKKIAAQVFFCNPASRTADADCGKGFMCYSSAQALGGSICVPECDPHDATTCDGACTASGACLQRCTVPVKPTDADPCPAPLLCSRTTDSPIEAAGGNDGVCLPLNAVCATNADCTSPVFTECTAAVNGSAQGMGLLTSGNACVQGKCNGRGIACEPGSACVRDILPMSIPAPDVCSPICTPVRDRKPGETFNECLPGLTCLSDAFPQTDAPACAPGFAGWLCVDKLGCTAGGCYDWGDTSDKFKGFETCAPPCKSDDDCVPFDRGGNPTFLSHNICHEGVCRDFGSLFFPMICTEKGPGHCKLDPEADCVFPSADMGMVPMMGLGALGGTTAVCVHGCSSPSDCGPLAAALHIPMTCGTINQFPACVPMIPVAISCRSTDECFGDLTCEGTAGKAFCTRRCGTSKDCADDPALGSLFFCGAGFCLPKASSGDPAGAPDQCLSGQGVGIGDMGVKCLSPTGWSCNDDSQCANGQCELLPDTVPEFGRCR